MAQREIKFRAWLIKDKNFLDDFMLNSQGMMYVIEYWGKKPYYVDPDDVVLEQYTDIKDKNGVEIYEGDIVKALGDKPNVITFEHGAFNWFWEGIGESVYMGSMSLRNGFEVIGNIHENSELLEAE